MSVVFYFVDMMMGTTMKIALCFGLSVVKKEEMQVCSALVWKLVLITKISPIVSKYIITGLILIIFSVLL